MSERKIGGEGLIQRIKDAHESLWIAGRYPLRVRMNTRTIRFLLWYMAGKHGGTPPPFDPKAGDTAQMNGSDGGTLDVEISEDIPDMTFGWTMGHNDKRPDRIGPGKGE